jgi:hypothetical protein
MQARTASNTTNCLYLCYALLTPTNSLQQQQLSQRRDLPGYRAPRGTTDAEQVALIGQALWKVHRVGVEGRVRRACKHLLRDTSVSKHVRRQLAEALVCCYTLLTITFIDSLLWIL